MKKISEEWVNAANDDLKTVGHIINDDSLTHIASFHCQQAVEKAFKSLMEEHSIEVPKIHKLVTLFEKVKHIFSAPVDIEMLKVLDELYIDARYPGNMGLLPDGKPTTLEVKSYQEFAVKILGETQNLLK